MRTVNKGRSSKSYKHYRDALNDLYEKIGDYCSYCEMPISAGGEVEHVISRHKGGSKLSWNNLLVACRYCNSTKSSINDSRAGYVWPDRHLTIEYFEYAAHLVHCKDGGSASLNRRIEKTHKLVGLDKVPGHPNFKKNDQRWKKRTETYIKALEKLEQCRRHRFSNEIIDDVIELAESMGFFSIWYDVFQAYPRFITKLKDAFPGTDIP